MPVGWVTSHGNHSALRLTASHSWSTFDQRVKTQAPSDFWSFCILLRKTIPIVASGICCAQFSPTFPFRSFGLNMDTSRRTFEQRATFRRNACSFHPDARYINGRGHFTKILFKIQYSYRSCMHRMVPSATMATCPDACRINATGNAQIMRVLVHFALWRLPNKLSY